MSTEIYFEYGGMKHNQNTKAHICDNSGVVLCGVKSNWMEAGEEIDNNGYVQGRAHLMPITDAKNNTCQKCLKKWLALVNHTPKGGNDGTDCSNVPHRQTGIRL